MKNKSTCVALLITLLVAAGARAALPLYMPYQGQLSTNGVLVTATQVFSFAMYTNSAVAWQSGASVTTLVERGFFSVTLGRAPQTALAPALFDGANEVYLEVAVGPLGAALTTLAPQKKIISAAYAADSDRLDGLRGSAYMKRWTNVVVVGPGGRAGGADTNTLAAGIALAGGKATAQQPYAVLLLPGSYAGAMSTANVAIVGLARDACVITSTLAIAHSIGLQNFAVKCDNAKPGIDISTCSPYLNNLRIDGGSYGVRMLGLGKPTLVNLDVYGTVNAALRDEMGALVDGLRVHGRAAFDVVSADAIDYNNIVAVGEPNLLGAITDTDGAITALRGTHTLNIQSTTNLLLQDLDIVSARTGSAVRIGDVGTELQVKDAVLVSMAATGVTISNTAGGTVRFNDVRLTAPENYKVMDIAVMARVDLKECELYTSREGGSAGVWVSTGDYLYVQSCWITAGGAGIALAASNTQAYVYDTTILTGTASGPLNAAIIGPGAGGFLGTSVTGMPPRIADTRLETDTKPSQNAGVPGWNAFGANGAVGGQEDLNGNIVAPGAGTPVAP